MMLIMPLSFALSLKWGVPVAFTWAVFWLSPLMVLCLGMAWQHERPSPATWIGVALGSLGAVVVISPSLPESPLAVFAPFLMALSFSVYIVMTRSLRTENLATNLFYSAVGVFALLTLFMPSVWITPTLHDLAMVVGIGAFGFISLLVLDHAIRRAPVSVTSPALYFQIVCVSVVVTLTNGYGPAVHVVIGIFFIVAAAALAWTRPIEFAHAGTKR
jgi:drug/metabolite transporter (DMT)-like permease